MSAIRLIVALAAVVPAAILPAYLATNKAHSTAAAPMSATGTRVSPCPAERQLAAGGCACDSETNWTGAACTPLAAKVRPRIGTMVMGTDLHSDNCVYFVRDRVRALPFGLATWKGKLAIINAHQPQPGDVALIEIATGVYRDVGHVAIVEAVTDTSVTILEANYYAGQVSRRTATAENADLAARMLGIAGYFRP